LSKPSPILCEGLCCKDLLCVVFSGPQHTQAHNESS